MKNTTTKKEQNPHTLNVCAALEQHGDLETLPRLMMEKTSVTIHALHRRRECVGVG